MIVTDVKWTDQGGETKEGFHMDPYLAENLHDTPKHLANDNDVVIIISARGGVRKGKSTFMMQIGYYLAWLQAGGKMHIERDEEGKLVTSYVKQKPTQPVHFGFENLVYSPNELISTAQGLYKKFGKHQIIGYDETRGLDSAGTMSSVNKMLSEFFQFSGNLNHIYIIVIPDFFKLNESFCTSRSNFLIDIPQRKYFNFYGQKSKEWLYIKGKKKLSTTSRYLSQTSSFHGSFNKWLPFDQEEYEAQKIEKLKNANFGTREQKMRQKMQGILYLLKTETNFTTKEIAEKLSGVLYREVSAVSLENTLSNYNNFVKRHLKGGDVPEF